MSSTPRDVKIQRDAFGYEAVADAATGERLMCGLDRHIARRWAIDRGHRIVADETTTITKDNNA